MIFFAFKAMHFGLCISTLNKATYLYGMHVILSPIDPSSCDNHVGIVLSLVNDPYDKIILFK
jgi:hypothetical protein